MTITRVSPFLVNIVVKTSVELLIYKKCCGKTNRKKVFRSFGVDPNDRNGLITTVEINKP